MIANLASVEDAGWLSDQAGPSCNPRPANPLLRWFLILTKPAGESTAKRHLERQGYRVYYPRLLHPVLRRGRWIDQLISLFPRYLFVQLDPTSQSLAPVRSTTGVANVVRFGTQAAVVPAVLVDELMCRADPETGLHRLGCKRILERGGAVRIVGGAFEGMEGIFDRDDADERVVVLLNILSQNTPVRLPGRFVVPAQV